MALKLGGKVEGLQVYLNPGYDFMYALRPKDVDGNVTTWKPGVTLELHLGARVFPADMEAELATWVIDADDVDAVVAQEDSTAVLVWVEPGGTTDNVIRLPMFKGQVIVNA